jgi:hypothetical protein
LATSLIVELCEAMEEKSGGKPTIEDLCELLAWGLRGCSADILAAINPFQVVSLKPKLSSKGKIRPGPGDVVAIPAGIGEFYLIVYVGRFRGPFGDAFGVIRGRHRIRPLPVNWKPDVLKRLIGPDVRPIASGRWRIIGNRPDLLTFFPPYPEHFHSKRGLNRDDPRIGPFGSAESPTNYEGERDREGVVDYSTEIERCVLRHLSEREAREIGLDEEDFFQFGLEEQTVQFLHRLNG